MDNNIPEIAKTLLNKEFFNITLAVDQDKKRLAEAILLQELQKYLNQEDFLSLSPNIQESALKFIVKLLAGESIKLIQTPLAIEHYNFIIEILVDTTVNTMITCLNAEFDRDELISIMKKEAHLGLLMGISILRDEETIDESTYSQSVTIVGDI